MLGWLRLGYVKLVQPCTFEVFFWNEVRTLKSLNPSQIVFELTRSNGFELQQLIKHGTQSKSALVCVCRFYDSLSTRKNGYIRVQRSFGLLP